MTKLLGYINAIKMLPIITEWKTWTPTGDWTTNTTYVGRWRRMGDTAQYQVRVDTSGAPNAATLNVNLPTGHVIDTNKIIGTDANEGVLGHVRVFVSGSGNRCLSAVGYSTTTQVRFYSQSATGTDSNAEAAITETFPTTFAANDQVYAIFQVPIVGWRAHLVGG